MTKKNLTLEQKHQMQIEIEEAVKSLKKILKLYNCNVNCKDTLLEPGMPNQLPKKMREEYKDSELLKMYEGFRKAAFKNKTNVLDNNFYENTPKKMKNKLIKEGAISQCMVIPAL